MLTRPVITIVGDGVVALAMASLLQDSCEVNLVVRDSSLLKQLGRPASQVNLTKIIRPVALNHSAIQVLQKIGVWPVGGGGMSANEKVPDWSTPITRMEIGWEKSGLHFNLDPREHNLASLGHVVSYCHLRQELAAVVDKVRIIPTTPIGLVDSSQGCLLKFADGMQLKSDWLVAADGGDSWVRSVQRPSIVRQDLGQVAVFATLHGSRPHQNTAFQRFSGEGPLALLPLPDPHQVGCVWSVAENYANYLQAASQNELERCLTGASKGYLGKLSLESVAVGGGLYSARLDNHLLDNFINGRVIYVGDAAHKVLPLAGRGLGLGLGDVASLASIFNCSQVSKDQLQLWAGKRHAFVSNMQKAFVAIDKSSRRPRAVNFAGKLHGHMPAAMSHYLDQFLVTMGCYDN